MKIVAYHDLLAVGAFAKSPEWTTACQHVDAAVKATDWPHGSGKFLIYPESGKKSGKGNGVVPIKVPCIKKLVELGWVGGRVCQPLKGDVIRTGDWMHLQVFHVRAEPAIAPDRFGKRRARPCASVDRGRRAARRRKSRASPASDRPPARRACDCRRSARS